MHRALDRSVIEPLDQVLLKYLLFSVAGSAEAPENEAVGMAQAQISIL